MCPKGLLHKPFSMAKTMQRAPRLLVPYFKWLQRACHWLITRFVTYQSANKAFPCNPLMLMPEIKRKSFVWFCTILYNFGSTDQKHTECNNKFQSELVAWHVDGNVNIKSHHFLITQKKFWVCGQVHDQNSIQKCFPLCLLISPAQNPEHVNMGDSIITMSISWNFCNNKLVYSQITEKLRCFGYNCCHS